MPEGLLSFLFSMIIIGDLVADNRDMSHVPLAGEEGIAERVVPRARHVLLKPDGPPRLHSPVKPLLKGGCPVRRQQVPDARTVQVPARLSQ